jgi:hypothetical protein
LLLFYHAVRRTDWSSGSLGDSTTEFGFGVHELNKFYVDVAALLHKNNNTKKAAQAISSKAAAQRGPLLARKGRQQPTLWTATVDSADDFRRSLYEYS